MALRIISGRLKGRQLQAPAGYETRPITDRIKESLFNIWQTDIVGAVFLDLFAGSGSVGIEAFSRGARRVVMVERSDTAVQALQANMDRCQMSARASVLNMDVFQALDVLERQGERFTLVFVDPPFTEPELAPQVLRRVARKNLARRGQVVIRARSGRNLPEGFGCLRQVRSRRYGESTLYFYMFAEED
jgi:16S rRNA (guanine(966)-N(2))-methyltransferase RsmD